jgi:hypothetical protein
LRAATGVSGDAKDGRRRTIDGERRQDAALQVARERPATGESGIDVAVEDVKELYARRRQRLERLIVPSPR